MNIKMLLQYAYEAILDDIDKRERRVIAYEADSAPSLPSRSFYRATSRHDAWAQRKETARKEYETDTKRLQELYQLIEDLEAKYKEWHDLDDVEAAAGLADFIKSRR